MINYKGFIIRPSLLSPYLRVYSPSSYLYPNTFDSVAQAKQFVNLCLDEKKVLAEQLVGFSLDEQKNKKVKGVKND